jgi:ketol-acid reductoisomerase
MTRVFHDEDADPTALATETVAILGYGIQGRAQALTLRDSGVRVVVGNRHDRYRARAEADGFAVFDLADAARQGTLVVVLLPDEIQPRLLDREIVPELSRGDGVIFAHGFCVRYGLVELPSDVDVMLLAPRMPGQYLRQRYLDGWGIPAFVAVQQDATHRAWARLLATARALGVTRCGALELSFAGETELDHFSEHFLYPLMFRTLEIAFDALVEAGFPPEAALMELHGSGELGQVLQAAASEGLYGMIDSHASPACQVGIARHWKDALADEPAVRRRIDAVLGAIRDGSFARYLQAEQRTNYPDLARWRDTRSAALINAEQRLREMLHDRGFRS